MAALQKAHGSHKGADKLMQAHGISRAGGKEHNLSALEVKKSDRGFAVSHKPTGMALSHHPTKGAAESARQGYADTPHNLHEPLTKDHPAYDHLVRVAQAGNVAAAEKSREASLVSSAKRQRHAGREKVSNPAKPGDLVVVSREQADYTIGKGRSVSEEHTPGVVTHVHSDGTPIAYRDASGSFRTVGPRDQTRVMPQEQVNVHGFLGHVAATNRWHAGSDSVKAHYGSLTDVQAQAKPFRLDASPKPAGKDFRSMTPAEKISAAAVMYGAGSKQHLAAKKRFAKK